MSAQVLVSEAQVVVIVDQSSAIETLFILVKDVVGLEVFVRLIYIEFLPLSLFFVHPGFYQ